MLDKPLVGIGLSFGEVQNIFCRTSENQFSTSVIPAISGKLNEIWLLHGGKSLDFGIPGCDTV